MMDIKNTYKRVKANPINVILYIIYGLEQNKEQ